METIMPTRKSDKVPGAPFTRIVAPFVLKWIPWEMTLPNPLIGPTVTTSVVDATGVPGATPESLSLQAQSANATSEVNKTALFIMPPPETPPHGVFAGRTSASLNSVYRLCFLRISRHR
jgi:hypothetical protein